jgi:MFS transporter, MCT family, solute carrier family 16 (monocarboxylic acid transporters), member 14
MIRILATYVDFSVRRYLVLIVCFHGFLYLGFYTPFVYIPAKSESLGVSMERTSLLVSVMGATNTVFRLVAGYVADLPFVDGVLLHNLAIILAGVATCLVCVFNTWELLMMYAALFGMLTGRPQ